VVKDSIEGWADAAHVLLCQYLHQGYYEDYDRITFDFSNIREKGAVISSGGSAPGAEPLKVALEKIDAPLALEDRRGASSPAVD
jgi:ribonucleoside-triphosphate reductase (thioredoxin)